MTPAERQLVTDLFDRLATLEDAQRDPDAERVIRDGLAQAPNAVYALVQTALVQDEALRQANDRIEELESQLGFGNAQRQGGGGFLDNMRDSIFGRRDEQRGSVPSVRPGDAPGGAPMGAPPAFGGSGPGQPMGGPGYGAPGQMQPPPEPQGGRGGSFLGTAAAATAGVIGGSMLLDGIRSMTGTGRVAATALPTRRTLLAAHPGATAAAVVVAAVTSRVRPASTMSAAAPVRARSVRARARKARARSTTAAPANRATPTPPPTTMPISKMRTSTTTMPAMTTATTSTAATNKARPLRRAHGAQKSKGRPVTGGLYH
jgi:hypothetical protein